MGKQNYLGSYEYYTPVGKKIYNAFKNISEQNGILIFYLCYPPNHQVIIFSTYVLQGLPPAFLSQSFLLYIPFTDQIYLNIGF